MGPRVERDVSPHDNGELLLAEGEVDSRQPVTNVHRGAVVLLPLGTPEEAKGRLRVGTVSGPPSPFAHSGKLTYHT